MTDLKSIDWSESTNEHRKILFTVVKRLVDSGAIDWNSLYERALGTQAADIGVGYDNNFREGRISRRKASMIYAFLQREFPSAAWEVHYHQAPDKDRGLLTWHRFIDLNITPRALTVVPKHYPKLFVEHEEGANSLSLDEHFFLQLDSPFDGFAVCMRALNPYWFVQGLSNEDFQVRVCEGRQLITRTAQDGVPNRMMQREQGLHYFLVFVGSRDLVDIIIDLNDYPHPIRDSALNALPDRIRSLNKPWFMTGKQLSLDSGEEDESAPGVWGEP
jgi:hypothetical protein